MNDQKHNINTHEEHATPNLQQEKPKINVDKKAKKTAIKSELKAKKRTAFSRFLRTATIVVILLLIGIAIVFFAFYLPKSLALNKANSELARLQQVEADYTQLQADYSAIKEKHQVALTLLDIFKIQNNVNIARIALLENDQTRFSQAINYIDRDIDTLDISASLNTTVNLKARMDEVKKSIPNDTKNALKELGLLFNDLLLLANNLEITE